MKKKNRENAIIPEHNHGHVPESDQQLGKGISFSKLKARFLHISKSHAGMIDVTEYTKVTVQTDHGVYQAGDCEKRHTERQKPDHCSTAKLYGAECRFEGHVGDIKGFLDENEDASQLRISDHKE